MSTMQTQLQYLRIWCVDTAGNGAFAFLLLYLHNRINLLIIEG